MTVVRFTLTAPAPFDLRVALFGHGWIDLAPNEWDEAQRRLKTVIAVGPRAVDVEVELRSGRLHVRVDAAAGATRERVRRSVGAALSRMLRLEHDFDPFWRRCAGESRLRWVARRGAGRLLAGATLFEDLMKLLLTTNCSWAATRLMSRRLVDALGARSPSGASAFPDARRCAAAGGEFWRDVVHAGYRSRACRELADGFASGRLAPAQFEARTLATDELRDRLLALHGFGPYAAGQALRLLGRHDDLALDSWCRAKLAQQTGRARPPSDHAIERAYAPYAEHRGLVLWMDLTREWHGEGEPDARDAVVIALRSGTRRTLRADANHG